MVVKTREKKGLLKGLGDVMGNVYGGSGFIADSGMQVENLQRIQFRLLQ